MERDLIDVFADGSFNPRLSVGGWAFVAFQAKREIQRDHGSAPGDSNNTFEVLAILKAVIWINTEWHGAPATIWTDSSRAEEGCRRFRPIWRNNDWRRIEPNFRKRKRTIRDVALWQELDRQLSANPCLRIEWCRGHDGIEGNELADTIARAAAKLRTPGT
ncbi:RNase H family protein [Sinorhizobium sp. RAC02]|uniref:RNase H family protein n=1 Tax=Sinorhizobium sp. RAC02 TaxID=1842534 RepID=UPI00083CF70C|nr:RNase H family protein [Sinorhizobium sp. RAC02]AOF91240.1 RNase H family protein [Sinorhizobium sp. RAC02]